MRKRAIVSGGSGGGRGKKTKEEIKSGVDIIMRSNIVGDDDTAYLISLS